MPVLVSTGEALIDFITLGQNYWETKLGGSGWNVARVAANLGVQTAFAGAVSQDYFGEQLWKASLEAGLDLRFLQRVSKSPLLAMVYCVQPPKYTFLGADSADLAFEPTGLPDHWMASARWLHVGGISLARPPLADRLVGLAQQAKKAGIRISYDPNFRSLMDQQYDVTLQHLAQIADLIKVSGEDLEGLFRTTDQEQALQQLRGLNPNATILLTRASAGATLYHRHHQYDAQPPNIQVHDTIGAGDATIGALLVSLIRFPQAEWTHHLRYSIAAGSAACQQSGATPPSESAIDTLFGQI